MRGESRLVRAGMIGVLFLGACERDLGNAPPPAVAPPAVATVEDEALHEVMEDIDRSFQYLRRNMNGQDNEAALLQRVATMRERVAIARTRTPEQVEQAAEMDRAALAAKFDEHLAGLPPLLDELEAAIKAGDRATARAALSRLHDAEHAGHDALGVEEH